MAKKYTYEQAMIKDDFSELSPKDFCKVIGRLIDTGFSKKEILGVEKGVNLAKSKSTDNFDEYWRAVLYYYMANGWGSLQRLRNPTGPDLRFSLESVEVEQEILHLRKALVFAEKFENAHLIAQILTNLGNAMDHVGRFIEAIFYWHLALAIMPGFGMAIGNLGKGLFNYARVLFDEGHRFIFCKFAFKYLQKATKGRQVYEEARRDFAKIAKTISDRYGHDNLVADMDLNNFSLGRSKIEITYREWCLSNGLFLNPLNDFVYAKMVSHDSFFLPSITAGLNDPPIYHTIYNQLKQEYVTARYLLFEAISESKPHFSDKGNLQVDTLDYAVYSLNTKK